MSRPTIADQRAKTPCTRRSVPQPWSATSRSRVASTVCGSRSSGWAPLARPGSLRRARGAAFAAASLPRRGSLRVRPARPRAIAAGQVEPLVACARAAARAPSGPPPQASRVTCPVGDRVAGAAQRLGHVVGDRGRDQHLLGAADQLGELLAAAGVELGEDVVEDQDRVVARAPQQVVRRQPERQRERPRLAVAGVALTGRSPSVSTRSSRCGPTRLIPRSSSSPRRRSSSASSDCSSTSWSRRSPPGTSTGRPWSRRRGWPRGRRPRRPCPAAAPRSATSRSRVVHHLGAEPGQVGVPDAERARARPRTTTEPKRAARADLSSELRCLSTRS